MADRDKQAIIAALCFAIVGVGLLVTSFSTDFWIYSSPVKTPANSTTGNNTMGGNVNYGLFSGYSALDYSFGERKMNLEVQCDSAVGVCAMVTKDTKSSAVSETLEERITQFQAQNSTQGGHESECWFGLFSFPLYVSTLVLLVLGLVLALVAVGFSFFNIFGRPIETISGVAGLFLWNSLAAVLTLAGVGVYTALYLSQLRKNVLTKASQKNLTSEDHTDLHFSYFMAVGAAACFLLNILILALAGQKCRCGYFNAAEKEVDNGMILY